MRFNMTRFWYSHSLHFITLFLLPFSWLFYLIVIIRRFLYRFGILKTHHFSVPIIVVGNITVGGTGKTPLVIELAHILQEQGYRPGIVSRGIGGKKHQQPHWVQLSDTAEEVGDEAILLLKNAACPVVIGVDRVAAVQYLLQQSSSNVVISDDGLQHYRLGRAIEIAVVDGQRYFGNQCMLPMGPLREPIARLRQVDYVVINGNADTTSLQQRLTKVTSIYSMVLQPIEWVSLQNEQTKLQLAAFSGKKIHAVAAIGHPERFFQILNQYVFDMIPHIFPDHYIYQMADLNFTDSLPIVMTEKDAVKCLPIQDQRYWYLKVGVKLDKQFQTDLLMRLSIIPYRTTIS